MTDNSWIQHFPPLQAVDDEHWQQAMAAMKAMTIPAGTTLYRVGDECGTFIMVLDGSIRVQMISELGHEIVLYRVEEGQCCILTTACLFSREKYGAEGITETEVRAVAMPAPVFQETVAHSPGFRQFVFSSYGQRLANLFMLIEAIAFGRMDSRLISTLLEQTDASGTIRTTHQDLARELGTAREVISRLLKDFERRGLLQLSRGMVTLTDPSRLRAMIRD